MKSRLKAALVLVALGVLARAATADMKITFDETNPGKLPKGWETGITGKGKAKWEVVSDDTAPSRPNVLHSRLRTPSPARQLKILSV